MSKCLPKLLRIFTLTALVCLVGSLVISAQDIEVRISVASSALPQIKIEGRILQEKRALRDISFLRQLADVSALGERIENFRAAGKDGKTLEVKKLIDGEFQTTESAGSWQYEVRAGLPQKLTDSAHISWLGPDLGILMLGDLLPRFGPAVSAKVSFELPAGWKIFTAQNAVAERTFYVGDIENAVFLLGKGVREKNFELDKHLASLTISGEWKFSDEEALEMARSILAEHKSIFKEIPQPKTRIILLPFPQVNTDYDRWRAETRGSTVTIISGALPFKSQAVQRLHEQLRHELFHLWIPNGLALSGNYDWFYEGFTIYQALQTGVELGQIRFVDFLNTLGQAYRIERRLSETNNVSLIEASEKRWTSSGNFIYAKGLAVAFLCDLTLLRESRGKRSLKDVFRQVYRKHRSGNGPSNQIQDGNTAVLGILKTFPELRAIIQQYLEGKLKLEWQNDLTTAGLELDGTQIKVMPNPNGRQKDLLDKLGYNQWRKIGQKTK
jgi:predicted metalloprotease with PDZ domain